MRTVTAATAAAATAAFEAHQLALSCVKRPLHAAAVQGFSKKHAAFAGTVRLVLRWLSSLMFGDHIPIEAVELIVAVSGAPSVLAAGVVLICADVCAACILDASAVCSARLCYLRFFTRAQIACCLGLVRHADVCGPHGGAVVASC